MSPIDPRSVGVAVAAALVISGMGFAPATMAADSPEGAVEAFFDMAQGGDFSGIDGVVCASDRDAMREAFDFSAQLGIEDASLVDALSFDISGRSVELIDQSGATATVAARANLSVSVPDDQVQSIVRTILEAERGPDDPPVSDADVEMMGGFMGSALNQIQEIDEEVTVVLEDGQWLVCGGLIDEPEPAIEPTVSSEGLCGIASPDELSALGNLEYDSASGFSEFCTFSTTDFDRYHSASVSLGLNQDVEQLADIFGADQEVEVAGIPGLATGVDAFGNQLLLQVGGDVLQISVTVDGDDEFEWLAQATAIGELLVPRIPSIRGVVAGPTPAPTPVPTPEISLCESLSLEVLDDTLGLGIDEAQGDRFHCSYVQLDGDPGWHTVTLSLSELALDDYRTWLPDARDATIAGQPALSDQGQAIVELPGRAWTLQVSGFIDANDESVAIDLAEMLEMVAEIVVPDVVVPEPSVTFAEEPVVDVRATGLERPLCDYLDLDAINALGVLEFSDLSGFDAATCSMTQTDPELGFASVSITAGAGTFDELRSFYPHREDLTVGSYAAFVNGAELYLDAPGSTIAFFAFLTDGADGASVEPREIMMPIAEMLAMAIEAGAG